MQMSRVKELAKIMANSNEYKKYLEKYSAKSYKNILRVHKQLLDQGPALKSNEIKLFHSFWYNIPENNFPPRSIHNPNELNGGNRLSLSFYDPNLSPNDRKNKIKTWCELLPTLNHVKFLWFNCKANQKLFDAACQMKSLEGLYIKWGGITSIESITKLKDLKFLHIGSSPSIQSLYPLSKLSKLDWLELENIRALSNLEFIREMPNLRGLAIKGDSNSVKYINAESLEPLKALIQLYWLSLNTIKIKDRSLKPLSELHNLRLLYAGNHFELEEIAHLAGSNPNIHSELLMPVWEMDENICHQVGIKCKKCNKHNLVILVGKSNRTVCTNCHQAKVIKHIERFYELANDAYLSKKQAIA